MDQPKNELSILSLAEDDRPREKLLHKGLPSLSNAELIAILIGSGNTEMNAVDLSKLILKHVDNDLNELGKQTIKELQVHKGIGEAKALTIVSALELGRRRKESEPVTKPKIISSEDVYDLLSSTYQDLAHEECWIALVNRANFVIKTIQISMGGIAGTVVDQKIIFKHALEHNASGIVLTHNHPSGNLVASDEDKNITQKITKSCKLLDIKLLDHVIFAGNDYLSFSDENMI
ncbi:MAG: DNA repair protein RadC [Cyclobacteriaceae bacterium]